jgi:plant G-box-binding factor
MSIEPPKLQLQLQQHHDEEGQLHKKSSNNSNGNCAGGSHKPEANTTRWDTEVDEEVTKMRWDEVFLI